MKVIEHYPSFFSKEEGLEVGREITLAEIQKALSRFSKYKSTGTDGWNVELFLVVFDIMGENLLEVVEFYRNEGFMSGSLNATFITLIPKKR